MTKKYLSEIENFEQIKTFEDLSDYLKEDEQGQYFEDTKDFDWWNELANAMQYLEDEDVEYNEVELTELEDYITIAKKHGFNNEKMKNKNYTREDIIATYADDFNEFIEIEFINHDILRVNYRDLPFDIKEFDDNFQISKEEFKQMLEGGEWQ